MSKVGRNDPCPCGSGKKYKKCHPNEYDSGNLLAYNLPKMPLLGCWIAEDHREMGMSPVFVVRCNPENNRLVIAVFLCDLFCLGVKDAMLETHTSHSRLDFMLNEQPQTMQKINYREARDVVLESVKYANNIGFSPHIDYEKAKAIIEPDQPFRYKKVSLARMASLFIMLVQMTTYEQLLIGSIMLLVKVIITV